MVQIVGWKWQNYSTLDSYYWLLSKENDVLALSLHSVNTIDYWVKRTDAIWFTRDAPVNFRVKK